MKKHLGNMISCSAVCINLVFIIVIANNMLSIYFILLSVLVAAVLDIFDGKVARAFLTEKEDFIFGEAVDSLCDIINFGVVPVFAFLYFFKENIVVSFLICCFYLCSSLYRLARFSKIKSRSDSNDGFYTGLPITVAGPFSILFTLVLRNNLFFNIVLQIVLAILMVSNIKVKKF